MSPLNLTVSLLKLLDIWILVPSPLGRKNISRIFMQPQPIFDIYSRNGAILPKSYFFHVLWHFQKMVTPLFG